MNIYHKHFLKIWRKGNISIIPKDRNNLNRKTIEVIQQNPASKIDITEGRPMKGIACALRSMKSEMIVVINFSTKSVDIIYP
jgi:hypothetical protein